MTELDDDEKILIIAAAVLATVLFTMLCFAALYRTFMNQYATAYDNQIRQLAPFNASPSPQGGAGMSPVTIKLSDTIPMQDMAPMATNPMLPVDPPKSVNLPKPVPAWGSSTGSADWNAPTADSAVDKNEFFSANEQARIWAELREAEQNAETTSASVRSARTAAKTAAAAEHVVTFSAPVSQAPVSQARAEQNVPYMEPESPKPAQSPDYIDATTLLSTGESNNAPQATTSDEWWK